MLLRKVCAQVLLRHSLLGCVTAGASDVAALWASTDRGAALAVYTDRHALARAEPAPVSSPGVGVRTCETAGLSERTHDDGSAGGGAHG